MKQVLKYIDRNPWILYASAIVLLITALFMHLGYFPIFVNEDEATRGLIAMEMMFSGDYVTPTIHGELYYNKPPLFNWLLAAFFGVFNSYDEFILRLPSILALILLGYLIYYFVKKEFGWKTGLLTALIYLTTGRLIMFESFFCQIDMLFSCFVYAAMMSVYFYHKKQNYWLLFVVSYAISALAFLSKGLPGIVFQGITLLVFFAYKREYKKFFSIQHITGALLFLIIIGVYYLFYHQKTGDLETIFIRLWGESTARTLAANSVTDSLLNFLMFPFEMLYHYAPWTIFIIYFFSRKFWKLVFGTPFLKFNFMIFFFNLLVYWTSPDVYPKYYMMLMPLFFTTPVYISVKHYREFRIHNKIIEIFFIVFGLMVLLAVLGISIFNTAFYIPDRILKTLILTVATLFFLWLYIKLKKHRLIIAVLLVLAGKFTFNWMNWVTRYPEIDAYKNAAVEVGKLTKGEPLHYYELGQDKLLQYSTSYYITAEREKIIQNDRDTIIPGIYYVMEAGRLNNPHRQGLDDSIIMQFKTKEQNRTLYLVKFYKQNELK
ncbi:MAG: glycosyltransferase family 39 protein [Bacteroidales bacterium]|nr:glycosyltransferase family 39 protein [Bacteroidales bacterium]MCF8344007.1 glycosyltransferase family 39 protein [Bacteroidales bacterium]MCF8349725.1 glycosyltransferase family 39 protein [Bacteroidales bacterium]MCF8376674.1 glycosyltransferase family 39 protein [Bacteroidales bacterium]MCF8401757.1 glycosyltransferase family 39 protein [Bacteroidales bacterium]